MRRWGAVPARKGLGRAHGRDAGRMGRPTGTLPGFAFAVGFLLGFWVWIETR